VRREARLRLSQRELQLIDDALAVYIDGLEGAIRHDERDLQLLRTRIQRAQWMSAPPRGSVSHITVDQKRTPRG